MRPGKAAERGIGSGCASPEHVLSARWWLLARQECAMPCFCEGHMLCVEPVLCPALYAQAGDHRYVRVHR